MIYVIIAGENSGDKLGASLMRAIKSHNNEAQFYGIGGALMQAENLKCLLPMEQISFFGFTTVFLHIRSIYRAINKVAGFINYLKPTCVITIDSPDFAIRVCRRINVPTHKIHYVAPTIWAMRPKRAKIFAETYDAILTLLPFEPPLFNCHKPNCAHFIGHNMFLADDLQSARNNKQKLIKQNSIIKQNPNKRLIGLMFGSRRSEITSLLPIFIETAQKILATNPDSHFIIVTFPKYQAYIAEYIAAQYNDDLPNPLPHTIISDETQRFDSMTICDFAIAASGTVSLHLAMLQVPHLVAYRVGAVNFFIGKMLLTIKQFNLFNIMAEAKRNLLPENHVARDTQIVPEYIQEKCTAEQIYHGANQLCDKDYQQQQLQNLNLLLEQMRPPSLAPDYIAKKINSILTE
ncbi:MAG: lipid-A-disaccharide synthase [Alphaproteobacteria bacterium]|nr:lipid-A-disaccharide synthase [Alphaproteobacteria bacterium]